MSKSYRPSVNFTPLSNTVIDKYSNIGCTALTIYWYYARLINTETDYAFPSIDTTAAKFNISSATVIRCNKQLEDAGLIEKTKGKGSRHNEYKILKPRAFT
jgi:biotin operon repressor